MIRRMKRRMIRLAVARGATAHVRRIAAAKLYLANGRGGHETMTRYERARKRLATRKED